MKIEEVKKIVMKNALRREVSAEDIADAEKCNQLTINQGRDGREYVWYLDEDGIESAADAETGKEITNEKIEQLFA